MAYIVTGMRSLPDVGFKSVPRHTAEGAMDLAKTFIVAGLKEVEVRDGQGALWSLRELDGIIQERGPEEAAAARRLAVR